MGMIVYSRGHNLPGTLSEIFIQKKYYAANGERERVAAFPVRKTKPVALDCVPTIRLSVSTCDPEPMERVALLMVVLLGKHFSM